VGQHEVDPEHVEVGEHEPAVDEDDLVLELDGGAVAADLPEAAEERDLDRLSHCRAPSRWRAPCLRGPVVSVPWGAGTPPPAGRWRGAWPWSGRGWAPRRSPRSRTSR